MNVLVSLHKGYGLGDSVSMSAVLHHVVAAHPDWRIDYRNEHNVGGGIVANVFAYDQPHPSPHYDTEVQICLYDTWHAFTDRPNTRVTQALRDAFNLPWRRELCQYRVNVGEKSAGAARTLLRGGVGGGKTYASGRPDRFVAVHYQGDSARDKKDLTDGQADAVCRAIRAQGCEPLILDWRNRCRLPNYRRLTAPVAWGKDAEMVCAILNQCAAFVGVDSGPAKCASACGIPSLVIWTGHHPAVYHDPAPRTTHLVPAGYHRLSPVCSNLGVVRWFNDNYDARQYEGDPVEEIKDWLTETLR